MQSPKYLVEQRAIEPLQGEGTDRQTDRDKDRERETETETYRDRQKERQRQVCFSVKIMLSSHTTCVLIKKSRLAYS